MREVKNKLEARKLRVYVNRALDQLPAIVISRVFRVHFVSA